MSKLMPGNPRRIRSVIHPCDINESREERVRGSGIRCCAYGDKSYFMQSLFVCDFWDERESVPGFVVKNVRRRDWVRVIWDWGASRRDVSVCRRDDSF
jgi:hypothetical protein